MKPSRAYAMAVGVVLSCSSFLFAQPQSMIDQEQPAINNTGGIHAGDRRPQHREAGPGLHRIAKRIPDPCDHAALVRSVSDNRGFDPERDVNGPARGRYCGIGNHRRFDVSLIHTAVQPAPGGGNAPCRIQAFSDRESRHSVRHRSQGCRELCDPSGDRWRLLLRRSRLL